MARCVPGRCLPRAAARGVLVGVAGGRGGDRGRRWEAQRTAPDTGRAGIVTTGAGVNPRRKVRPLREPSVRGGEALAEVVPGQRCEARGRQADDRPQWSDHQLLYVQLLEATVQLCQEQEQLPVAQLGSRLLQWVHPDRLANSVQQQQRLAVQREWHHHQRRDQRGRQRQLYARSDAVPDQRRRPRRRQRSYCRNLQRGREPGLEGERWIRRRVHHLAGGRGEGGDVHRQQLQEGG